MIDFSQKLAAHVAGQKKPGGMKSPGAPPVGGGLGPGQQMPVDAPAQRMPNPGPAPTPEDYLYTMPGGQKVPFIPFLPGGFGGGFTGGGGNGFDESGAWHQGAGTTVQGGQLGGVQLPGKQGQLAQLLAKLQGIKV